MRPQRIELLVYFIGIVLLGFGYYAVERTVAAPVFLPGLLGYLVALRVLGRHLAKREAARVASGDSVGSSATVDGYAMPAALSAIAFVTACTAHEAIGHGGMCLANGGHVTLLTSVYFHCSNGGPLIDAAGPTANLVVGAICWWLARARAASPAVRLLLVLTMAFNLFWGAGYFIFSAATNSGDWAFVLRQLELEPSWLWRSLMGALGVVIYAISLRAIVRSWPAGVSYGVAYFAAGVVACCAALFYAGPTLPAVREAAQESFLAAIGLLVPAFRNARRPAPSPSAVPMAGSNRWLVLASLVTLAFWLLLGRGFGVPGNA